MSTLPDISAAALALSGALQALYFSIGLGHVALTTRRLPTAAAGLDLPRRGTPAVCIVIPAHNEERALPELIATLRAQDYPNLRVVLSLDRCTDRSAQLARHAIDGDPRFQIVQVEQCEPGWAGKVHAAYRGVKDGQAENADLLLFADADTLFHPRCVSACVALLQHRNLDMLSLVSTMRWQKPHERVAQASACLELIRQYPLLKSNRDAGRRAFANGQFMLFTRDCYARFGGHHEVRRELLEDLRFAQILEYYSMRCGVLLADGLLVCRMYDSWAQFRKGWKRIFTEAAHRRPRRLRSLALGLFLTHTLWPLLSAGGLALGLAGLGFGGAGALACALGLASWLLLLAAVQKLAKGPPVTIATFPVGAAVTASILWEAARDLTAGRGTQWGGMTYDRRSTPPGPA